MKKLIKRVVAGAMAASMVMSSAVFATGTTEVISQGMPKVTYLSQEVKGDLTLDLSISNPMGISGNTTNLLDSKDLKIEVRKEGNLLISYAVEEDTLNKSQIIDGYTVFVTALNLYGAEITTENYIGGLNVKFTGLEKGDYNVVISAKGYQSYTSQTSKIDMYEQQISIRDDDGRFMPGDINGDEVVNASDLEDIKEFLGTNDNDADVNGDGVVDILDVSIINRRKSIPAYTGDGEVFSTKLLKGLISTPSVSDVVTVEGSLDNLVSGEDSVKLTQDEITEGTPLDISFDLSTDAGIEMSEIDISTPAGLNIESGVVLVDYIDENGEVQTLEKEIKNETPSDVYAISRSGEDNVVTINLGKKVVVKKITISVTKVTDSSGETNYVSIVGIEFIKDIVPENVVVETGKVLNVKVTNGSHQVTLNWDKVSNITGYRVYAGDSPNNLKAVVETVNQYATISRIESSGHLGLDNYKNYYFAVTATNGSWEGARSDIATGYPIPDSKPLSPDNVSVSGEDRTLNVKWGKTDDAASYNVYYKLTSETTFVKSNTSPITSLQYYIPALENGVSYDVYVTAVNPIGESGASAISSGKPTKNEVLDPGIPRFNQMSSDNILSIDFSDYYNYDANSYPNGFIGKKAEYVDGVKNDSSFWNVVDGDFSTHWTAHNYGSPKDFTFTLKDPVEMDYLVFVPRLDGNYKQALSTYTITVWEEGDNLSAPGKVVVNNKSVKMVSSSKEGNDGKYAILEFPKSNVQKIKVFVRQKDGGTYVIISASEIAFYKYDPLAKDVEALFKDNTYTTLKDGVTTETIDTLEARLNNVEGYYVSPAIMAGELRLARSILTGTTFANQKIVKGLNSTKGLQPLGVNYITALSGVSDEVIIYADIPAGETVTIVPTQYYAENSAWRGTPFTLESGKNVLDIAQIHSISGMKGGALYYTYTGSQGDAITLNVVNYDTTRTGITRVIAKAPVLELLNWDSMTEDERRSAIQTYVEELTAYTKTINLNATDVLNGTEISMPYALLSIPASTVLSGINASAGGSAVSIDKKVDVLYNNVLAWNEFMELMLTVNGIDEADMKDVTRENIRYMRMFGMAFMYAAGSHIGVGYNSTASLVQGRPTSITGADNANALFGWGIAHEVGHNKDTIGHAEVTNNIYALFGQVEDGSNDTLTSRVPFNDVFEKVAKGNVGFSNNVFVQLGMYWQLHLAYDDVYSTQEDNFYYKFNKMWKNGDYNEFDKDIRTAVIASVVAGKDLTNYFERWGLRLPDSAKEIMSTYPTETRSIWYLSDESRKLRIDGVSDISSVSIENTNVEIVEGTDAYGNSSYTAKSTWTVAGDTSLVQGFEVYKDGKAVGFVSTPDESGTYSYGDLIGAANNLAYEYSVAPVTKLGSVFDKATIGQVRVSYDVVVSRSAWTSEANESGNTVVTMNETTPVVGIKITNAPTSGTFKIVDENGNIIKLVDLSQGYTSSDGNFVTYFTKPGASSSDTRMWTYDITTLIIEELPAEISIDNIDFVQYPGDNIEIYDTKIGRLAEDYHYGDGEVIEAGTLVITGGYRGDPVFNYIKLKGRYAENSQDENYVKYVERDIDGYALMFAEIPDDGEVSTISDGVWFFVPNIQKEAELQDIVTDGEVHQHLVSILPESIKAEIYRSDNPNQADPARLTSTTIWIATPENDTMPKIVLTND